jgi:hypothetical protein
MFYEIKNKLDFNCQVCHVGHGARHVGHGAAILNFDNCITRSKIYFTSMMKFQNVNNQPSVQNKVIG